MRYTGLNPNGINQVASGSVAVLVENTRVATFGTNTLQVSGSTTLSGSTTVIGPGIVSGSFTVVTGSGIEFQVTNTGTKIGNISSDAHSVTGSFNISGSVSTIGLITSSGILSLVSG